MSWRDRDWARFTDEEREHFYGGVSLRSVSPVAWALFAVAVLLIGLYAYTVRDRSPRPYPPVSKPAPVVYSGAYGENRAIPGQQVACTAEGMQLGDWVCTYWQILQPGQTARPAKDPGGPCGVRHVDQATAAWVCDSTIPPDPNDLPPRGADSLVQPSPSV